MGLGVSVQLGGSNNAKRLAARPKKVLGLVALPGYGICWLGCTARVYRAAAACADNRLAKVRDIERGRECEPTQQPNFSAKRTSSKYAAYCNTAQAAAGMSMIAENIYIDRS